MHSPFVYHFITTGMYRKTTAEENNILKNLKTNRKNNKRLLKILQYFKPQNTVLLSKPDIAFTHLSNQLKIVTHTDISSTKSIDCIWLNAEDSLETITLFDTLMSLTHENTLAIVKSPHKNKKSQQQWQKIKTYPQTTVTIDAYHFGLVFFRKIQASEHFTLRI